jgi:hypothetical protein
MSSYRLYRLREALRPHFRQLPHLSGTVPLKQKDYAESVTITAASRYAAWLMLKNSDEPILVGDALLEDETMLYVTKFVGMEPAEWMVPDPKQIPMISTADQAPAGASA